MPLIHFFGEEMCFESLLNNDIKRYFFSSDLKFGIFMYYACIEFWKKFKKEFSFISLKKWERKYISKFDL